MNHIRHAKRCITWKSLLTSESFQKKAKTLFREGVLVDEKKLHDASSDGNLMEVRRLLSSGMLNVNGEILE